LSLPKIMELKKKYCYRLFLDDSYGVGCLGNTGRGVCEHFNVKTKDVEFLTGNLAAITSSVGGFCCANKAIIYHQRLNSSGYVYSASLPPLLAAASIQAFDLIDEDPSIITQMRKNAEFMYKSLSNVDGLTVTTSSPLIPLIHLRLSKPTGDRYQDELLLQKIVDEALANDVMLTRAKYVHEKEAFIPDPSIRVTVSSANTEKQLTTAVSVIKNAVAKVLKGGKEEQRQESGGANKRASNK